MDQDVRVRFGFLSFVYGLFVFFNWDHNLMQALWRIFLKAFLVVRVQFKATLFERT